MATTTKKTAKKATKKVAAKKAVKKTGVKKAVAPKKPSKPKAAKPAKEAPALNTLAATLEDPFAYAINAKGQAMWDNGTMSSLEFADDLDLTRVVEERGFWTRVKDWLKG